LEEIQKSSIARGFDKLTNEDIEEEIKKERMERIR